jgi:chromosome segregation ATPase
MATVTERVSVLETKVDNIEEKIDDLKVDVKEMHDCLDNTRDTVLAQLGVMTAEYRTNAQAYYQHADKLNAQQSAQHADLEKKISELEKSKDKLMMYAVVFLAFAAGAGWIGNSNLATLLKFVGL